MPGSGDTQRVSTFSEEERGDGRVVMGGGPEGGQQLGCKVNNNNKRKKQTDKQTEKSHKNIIVK